MGVPSFLKEIATQVISGLALLAAGSSISLLVSGLGLPWALGIGGALFAVTTSLYLGYRRFRARSPLPGKRSRTPLPAHTRNPLPRSAEGDSLGAASGPLSAVRVEVLEDVHIAGDRITAAAFEKINDTRRNRGLLPYYDAVRFLPVSHPAREETTSEVCLEVARIDYSVYATLLDTDSPEAREHALSLLRKADRSGFLAGYGCAETPIGLLGVQVCLVTSDQRLLLRRRGGNVAFARDRWDVSVSGFCGTVDVSGERVNLVHTVRNEVERELGAVKADPRQIRLLGIFRNGSTGAFDVLCYWRTDLSSRDLVRLLTEKDTEQRAVFDTGVQALEEYVWDYKNLVVPAHPELVAHAWRQCRIRPEDFEPQSLACVDLTLEAVCGEGLTSAPGRKQQR